MGRASSAKKVARAARGSQRPGTRRSFAWPATIAGVVILGMGLLALTLAEDDPVVVGPRIGDHWHAAYGISNCGTFIDPLTDVTADVTGIHSHGDGLVHMHPFSTRASGSGANLGTWGETVGLELTDTSIKAAGIDVENGDDCDGEPGVVQVKVWSSVLDTEGRVLEKDFAKYAPQDQELVTIAFLPAGADIPRPPDSSIANLDDPIDAEPSSTSSTSPTTSAVPGATDPNATTTSTTAAR